MNANNAIGIERLEIMGDAYADIEREQVYRDAPPIAPITDADIDAMHAATLREIAPKVWELTEKDAWDDAPLSAQIARMVAGDDSELFDQIKAELKGEI